MARKTSASISARASAARKAAGAGAGAAAGGDGGVYLPGRLTLLALVVLQTASLVLSFGAIAGPIVAQDGTGAGWVRAAERGLLAPLVVQWWYCSRLSAWIEKAAAAAAGGEVRGMFRQMEAFSLTLFAVPLLAALAGGAAVLLGAPVDRGTAVLGVYVALLALTPAVHILGTPGLHDDKDTHALRTWKLLLSLEYVPSLPHPPQPRDPSHTPNTEPRHTCSLSLLPSSQAAQAPSWPPPRAR